MKAKAILIGGSPCAGKSTLSAYLGEKYNYQVIKVDDYLFKHIEEADEKAQPIMYRWKTEPWHELFSREVDVQLKEEIAFYHEEWELVKRDILCDIKSDRVIIEGCALLPALATNLIDDARLFFIVPTENFQREKYALRTWAFDILKDAYDPKVAFNNWMERDIGFAGYIANEAEKFGFKLLVMEGRQSTEELVEELLESIGLL